MKGLVLPTTLLDAVAAERYLRAKDTNDMTYSP